MQYKDAKKIMIDQRKLETLFRIGCPDNLIIELLKTGAFTPTGDSLIDDNLETLLDYRYFVNNGWGGKRKGAGRKSQKTAKNNQDENQLENQDDNQDDNQDKIKFLDKDIDSDKEEDLITKLEKEELAKTKKPRKKVELSDYGEYEYLRQQMDRWIEYKKSRNDTYKSAQSIMVCLKRLHEYCGGNISVAEKIIDQSIGNNWKGLFPLKQQPQKAKSISSPDYVGEGSFLRRAEDDPFCADL